MVRCIAVLKSIGLSSMNGDRIQTAFQTYSKTQAVGLIPTAVSYNPERPILIVLLTIKKTFRSHLELPKALQCMISQTIGATGFEPATPTTPK
jgi:hypothetical protein